MFFFFQSISAIEKRFFNSPGQIKIENNVSSITCPTRFNHVEIKAGFKSIISHPVCGIYLFDYTKNN